VVAKHNINRKPRKIVNTNLFRYGKYMSITIFLFLLGKIKYPNKDNLSFDWVWTGKYFLVVYRGQIIYQRYFAISETALFNVIFFI
jgi:hypothetical protein